MKEMNDDLVKYRTEMQQELGNILAYWMRHTIDEENGGFYGRIENDNTARKEAPKGSVLNSRILWTFSAAYSQTKNATFLTIAHRAYNYVIDYFVDKTYGGVFWSVDFLGRPLDTKKQIYAIAFAVYGITEYYAATKDPKALQIGLDLYHSIITRSYDEKKGGYIEALTREWNEITDLRLSAKDFNEKKSMNTHLHVLEAFANLYKVWPDETLKQQINELIHIFLHHIIDPNTNHLILFFAEDWNAKSNIISYGDDIEAAWLLQEAATAIHDEDLIRKVKDCSIKLAEAAGKGLDNDGGLWYEKQAEHLVKEKHWWPQAEAMVGFYNAYQLTNDYSFLQKSIASWNFIQKHILDKKNGEWFWGVKEDYSIMHGEDKVGLWKGPYHNGRACMELLKRIG
jgi:mannobiose 2-epimerase